MGHRGVGHRSRLARRRSRPPRWRPREMTVSSSAGSGSASRGGRCAAATASHALVSVRLSLGRCLPVRPTSRGGLVPALGRERLPCYRRLPCIPDRWRVCGLGLGSARARARLRARPPLRAPHWLGSGWATGSGSAPRERCPEASYGRLGAAGSARVGLRSRAPLLARASGSRPSPKARLTVLKGLFIAYGAHNRRPARAARAASASSVRRRWTLARSAAESRRRRLRTPCGDGRRKARSGSSSWESSVVGGGLGLEVGL